MRENYRNSIASIKKFPQFTTMNVIDGQAGLIICASLIFYSLTIDNILNIIVLLILAAISITMLTGDNSILKRAVDAKERTERAQEEENVNLAFTATQMDLSQGKYVNSEKFQLIVDSFFGTGNATGNVGGNSYIITVKKSGKNYKMDSSGNISQLDELPLDMNPGVLEGKGTQDEPYVINSIEDLVAVSYNVNTGANLYEGKLITLGRDLDFQDNNSYANADAKYKYVDGPGCTPDSSSEKTIKNLMTDTSGKGFTPIGYRANENVFKGNFSGNGKSLSNLYINGTYYSGLFGFISSKVNISSLKLINCNVKSSAPTGAIIGGNSGDLTIKYCSIKSGINCGNITGGIIGESNGTLEILSCSNNATITSSLAHAGGIIGSGSGNIDMCYNTGKITSSSTRGSNDGVGGIIGNIVSDTNIYNCYNTGDIGAETSDPLSGGIAGYGNGKKVKTINCYNNGIIASKNPAGGIIGACGSGSSIVNCYNFNSVTSKNSLAAGIIASGSSTPIDNCYNSEKITTKSSQPVGGIAAVGATITNSYNTGIVSGESESITGYIIGAGSVNSTNKYKKQSPDIKNNGAIEFESETEMNQIMDVQRFIDTMNQYKYTDDEEGYVNFYIWRKENEFPVFVN